MRGTRAMRVTFAVLSPIFLLLCVAAIWRENDSEWMRYQEEFNKEYADRATAKLEAARAGTDGDSADRWQHIIDELSVAPPEIGQIYVAELDVADRCTTCHRGIDNGLFRDAAEPFRTHPGDLLKQHDTNTFGCTPCHRGQGLATTADGAHGHEANWNTPLLPTAYVQSSCGTCHEVTHGLAGAEVVSRGADLFMEKGCYACHEPAGIRYRPKFAPPLTELKSKLADPKDWIHAWVKKPADVSPDTAMPDFQFDDEEAGKISAFLLDVQKDAAPESVALQGASAEEGKLLFEERGCRGCHAVDADDHSVSPRVPHLAGIGSKVKAAWLDRWIADPKTYNPTAAMPRVALTDDERHAVVAYLLTLKREQPLPAAPELSGFDPEEGRRLVRRYECYGCHAIEGFEKSRLSVPDLREFAAKPLADLDFGRTDIPRTKWDWLARKLREPRAYESEKIELLMPVTKLSDDEMQAIIAYVLTPAADTLPASYSVPASPAQRDLRELGWMVAHLNCTGCHPLREQEPRIARFFERKTMTPPRLDTAGGRLQGQYFFEFLLEPKAVRPWLKLRMPTFGLTQVEARMLVDGFATSVGVSEPYTYLPPTSIPADSVERGKHRFQLYKCLQCHTGTVDGKLPEGVDPEDASIDLISAKKRLRPAWIKDFLAKPKQVAGRQTRMPLVFYTIEGRPKVDDPVRDIDDITTYLMGMAEPPQLAAEEEKPAAEAPGEATDWSNYDY
jgi:cytochrome c551/c552